MGAVELALLQQLLSSNIITVEAKEDIPAFSRIYIDQDGKAVDSEIEYNNILQTYTSSFLLSDSQTYRNWAWCKIDDTHYARVLRKPNENGHRVQILEFDFANCSFSVISESGLLTINLTSPDSLTSLQQAQIFKVDEGVLLVGLAYGEYDGSSWYYGACVYKITYDSSYSLSVTKIWSQDGSGASYSSDGNLLWVFPYDSTYFLLYSRDLSNGDYYMAVKKVSDGSETSRVSVDFSAWGGARFVFLNRPDLNKFFLYCVNDYSLYVFSIDSAGSISLANKVSVSVPPDWKADLRFYPVCSVSDDENNYFAVYCRHRNSAGTLLFSLTDGTQNTANETFESNLHYVTQSKYSEYCLLEADGSFYIPFTQDYSGKESGYYKLTLIKATYNTSQKKFSSQFICNIDLPVEDLSYDSYTLPLTDGANFFVFAENSIEDGTQCEKFVKVDLDDYFYSKKTCLISLADIPAGSTGKAFATKPVIRASNTTAGVLYVDGKYIATSTGYLVEIE